MDFIPGAGRGVAVAGSRQRSRPGAQGPKHCLSCIQLVGNLAGGGLWQHNADDPERTSIWCCPEATHPDLTEALPRRSSFVVYISIYDMYL